MESKKQQANRIDSWLPEVGAKRNGWRSKVKEKNTLRVHNFILFLAYLVQNFVIYSLYIETLKIYLLNVQSGECGSDVGNTVRIQKNFNRTEEKNIFCFFPLGQKKKAINLTENITYN